MSYKGKRWLITGAAGFIGSHICERLLLEGAKVTAIDNFITGTSKNIEDLLEHSGRNKKNFNLIKLDISNENELIKLDQEFDVVCHQAALGSVPRSLKDPLSTFNANVQGFYNIINFSKKRQISKFIYASSSSVYGDSSKLKKEEGKEGNPLSIYALTKSIDEQIANIYFENFEFKSIGLRYFNVFGPRQNPKGPYSAVIPKWINKAINNEDIEVYGEAKKIRRDFSFVSNIVQANLRAQNYDLHGVYNVACNKSISLDDLIVSIIRNLSERSISYQGKINILDKREGDIQKSLANIEKIKNDMGYSPGISFEEGLKLTMDWFLSENKLN